MIAREFHEGEVVLGKWRIVRRLGAGGMGVVYKVQHTYFERKFFVLKTLNPALGSNDDISRRMHREARVLGDISHPNVVQVLDAGVLEHGAPYFLMEFLEGTTLYEVLKRAPRGIGILSALGIGIEMCDALDVIHTRHGIIHRDLKPANIFLERLPDDGTRGLSIAGLRARTKLLDFGVVHLMSGGMRPTGKMFIGTYYYSAPEQLHAKEVTPQTDLYGVGLVLFEMLTGRHVFAGERGSLAIGEAHMTRPAPHILEIVDLPPDLAHLVMSCLEKKPADRPPSAHTLAEHLRSVLARLRATPIVADGHHTEPAGVETALDIACEQHGFEQGPTVRAGEAADRNRATPRARRGTDTSVDSAMETRSAAPYPDGRARTDRPSDPPTGDASTRTVHRPLASPKPRADTKPITVPIPRLLAPASRWRPAAGEAHLDKVYVDLEAGSVAPHAQPSDRVRPAAGVIPSARPGEGSSTGPLVRPVWEERTTRVVRRRRGGGGARAARGLLAIAGGVVLLGAVTAAVVLRRHAAQPSVRAATASSGPLGLPSAVAVARPDEEASLDPLPSAERIPPEVPSVAASVLRSGKPVASSPHPLPRTHGPSARP